MNRLRQYRFLFIVCAIGVLAGVWEYAHKNESEYAARQSNAGASKYDPDADPGRIVKLPPDRKVFVEVFPKSSNAEFDLGLERYNNHDYDGAVEHFRRGVATGVKTNEDLLWYYPMALLYQEADAAEIDAAVAAWRRNFPHSEEFNKYQNPYWSYAFQLMVSRAPRDKVRAAIDRWERKKPPFNNLPDLRHPPPELFPPR